MEIFNGIMESWILGAVIGGVLGMFILITCERPLFALFDWLSDTGDTFWSWVGRGFKRDKTKSNWPPF